MIGALVVVAAFVLWVSSAEDDERTVKGWLFRLMGGV